jgi:hypothetical protein
MFDRGVAAYGKGDYADAAAALSESYAREGDPETLFAWAQAERKLGHCSNAVELYNTLLAFDLPDENKKVVQAQLAECKQILEKDKSAAEPAAVDATPAEPSPPPAEPAPAPAPAPAPRAEPALAPEPRPIAETPAPERHPWWSDPVGDALVAGSVVGVSLGAAMLVSAHSADQAKATATTYAAYRDAVQAAHDHGEYGVIGLAAGGALAVGAVVWYATHRDSDHTTVTGWLAPASGGFAVSGIF